MDQLVHSTGTLPCSRSPPFFTVGIQISTLANPDSFDAFHTANGSDQLAVPYYQSQGTQGCVPTNIGALGLPGVGDGSNVTLQFVQDGSDGKLYQVRRTLHVSASLLRNSPFSYRVVHGLDPLLKLRNPAQCHMREHNHHRH